MPMPALATVLWGVLPSSPDRMDEFHRHQDTPCFPRLAFAQHALPSGGTSACHRMHSSSNIRLESRILCQPRDSCHPAGRRGNPRETGHPQMAGQSPGTVQKGRLHAKQIDDRCTSGRVPRHINAQKNSRDVKHPGVQIWRRWQGSNLRQGG